MTSLPPQPLSPLDGRYRPAVSSLADYLSEAGLNRARVEVEVEWLLALTDRSLLGTSPVSAADKTRLRALYTEFGQAEIDWLADREANKARRQGGRIPRPRTARAPRSRRGRRADAFRVHERGHQLHSLCPHCQARGDARLAA